MIRQAGRLRPASWAEAFAAVAERIKAVPPERVGVVAGDLQDAESMKAAVDLFGALGVPSMDCRQDGLVLGDGPRESWLFNSTLEGVEQADAVLLVGTNPRIEAAVFNARLRKLWLAGRTTIGVLGEAMDLTYGYEHLGAAPADLVGFASAGSDFARVFKGAERPAIIIGQGALTRPDSAAVLAAAGALGAAMGVVRDGWNGWNVLHTAAARVAGLDLGFTPRPGGKTALEMTAPGALDVLFLLGADEIDVTGTDALVVYLGTHGDAGAHRADVILPAAAYTEKNGLYVNTEGRVQRAERAVYPKGEAREDWAILRALSDYLGSRLPYDTLEGLRERLFAEHPSFGRIDFAPGAIPARLDVSTLGVAGEMSPGAFVSPVKAFHLTNPIARASVTMAECAAVASGLQMAAE